MTSLFRTKKGNPETEIEVRTGGDGTGVCAGRIGAFAALIEWANHTMRAPRSGVPARVATPFCGAADTPRAW